MRTATIGKYHKDITSDGFNCPPHAINAHRGGQLPLFAESDRRARGDREIIERR
jgi:hypothetical protein